MKSSGVKHTMALADVPLGLTAVKDPAAVAVDQWCQRPREAQNAAPTGESARQDGRARISTLKWQ